MPFRPLVLRLALVAASALVAFSGCNCGRECTVATDCPNAGQVCDQGVCKAGPDGGQQCDPACPVSQFCDTATLTCKTCDGTFPSGSGVNRGCVASQPICDTTAAGGAGVCRTCAPTSTDGGTDPGCGGQLPICDPTASNGAGACFTCTQRGGCSSGRVCEVTTHTCHTCLASTDGGVAPGCTDSQPICNATANSGQGRCLTCTSTAGCTGGTICDPAANGGVGVCDYCRPSTDGGVGQGCNAQYPVCDLSRDGGLGACIICNGSSGCTGGLICDTSDNSGSGKCKYCYDGSGATDPGCSSGAPVCNTAGDAGLGTCVGCLSSTDCTTSPNFVCDTTVDRCKVCVLGPPQQGCGASQVCDPAANGGQGACLGCSGDQDCALPDGGAGPTPYCRTTPPPGTCVECLTSPDCTDPTRPACNSSDTCGCTASADCSGSAATPVCDTAANSGNGVCKVCTPTEGCTDPQAPLCSGGTACVCPDNSVCPVGTACTGSPASCQPTDQTAADTAIGQFLSSPLPQPTRVVGAYVTYLKPPIGDPTQDPAGFFIQAIPNGNSLFVAVDPTTLTPAPNAGDRLDITLNVKGALSGLPTATSVTLNAVLSTGHPVRNLSTATPAGLNTDVTNFTDLVTDGGAYASDLVHLFGTLDGGAAAGAGHAAFLLATPGVPVTTSSLRLRLPASIQDQLDLASGCSVNVVAGPVWRFSSTTEPSVYSAADLQVLACTAPPRVMEASAPDATTTVVTFDRQLGAASVVPANFQIPNLVVSDATVSPDGYHAVLTTTPNLPGIRYSVTATNVVDRYGTPVGTPNSAVFWGAAPGPDAGDLVVNEIDYDNIGTDNAEFIELYNRAGVPVHIGNLEVFLVNGTSAVTPRREYSRIRLSEATDETDAGVESIGPGGFLVIGPDTVVLNLDAGVLRVQLPRALWNTGVGPSTATTNLIQNGGDAGATSKDNWSSDGVTLMDIASGRVIDTVFYEPSTDLSQYTSLTNVGNVTYDAVEGTRTSAFDSNGAAAGPWLSIGRDSAGTDTNNNDSDFTGKTVLTPGAPNP